jgi:hypothetical protein
VLENTRESKTSEDLFLKALITKHKNMSETDWKKAEQIRLNQKVLEMKMGDFHEELMGKFPGYETLPLGHITGCDVRKKDGTELFEVKNRQNTVKGSDGKHIINMLKNHKNAGVNLCAMVQINCPNGKVNRFGAPPEIVVWNGVQTYTHLSGRTSFFHDLLHTVNYISEHFKTFSELKSGLEIS